MIEIILDNNALQYICEPERYDRILKRLNKLYNDGILSMHFNNIVFLEQIIGLNRKYFKEAQQFIRDASKVFHKSLLLHPQKYVEDCILNLSNEDKLKEDRIVRTLIQEFCNYKSYDEASNNIGKYRDFHSRIKDKIFSGDMKIFKYMQAKKKDNTDLVFNKNTKDLFVFGDMIWRVLLKSYNLEQKTRYIPGKVLEKRLVSLCYLRDLLVYHQKIMFEGTKPSPGDEADYKQVVYLNTCDYIITNDRKFREKLNNCG
ncbi:MAG: hypothetical protein GY865_14965, partial [candidate division Zixibacteria bacterium]|nr:hypothetical protein [candidate division Zixibacteria bacterium]